MKKFNLEKTISVVVIIGVIIYVLFGTDFVNEVGSSVKGINKTINETESNESFNGLKVSFLDVGQADSILLQFGNHNALIDAGNNEDGEKLVSYFQNVGISHFDYVFGTHAHEDHIGGMDNIINNFEIDEFYMPDAVTTTKTFEDVLDALDSASLRFGVPVIDEELSLGDATIKVLYVGQGASDLNDTSIVLKITFGEVSVLLMGDAPTKIENIIINKDVSSSVLKVGHHGSSYSTSDDFLNKVNPKYAVISSGLNNSYGHPDGKLIDKLELKNIKVYRTDMDGTIILKTNGTSISFETVKTDTNG